MIVVAIIIRTVRPLVEVHALSTMASGVVEVAGAHVERQLTDVLLPPDQSVFVVCLAALIESVLENRFLTLAASAKALGDPRARPAERRDQVLSTGMGPTLQIRACEASQKNGAFIYLHPTLNNTRSYHNGVNEETRHGIYDHRKNAGKKSVGQKFCSKSETTPMKPDASSVENHCAGDDKQRS